MRVGGGLRYTLSNLSLLRFPPWMQPRFADKPKELQSPVRRVQQQLVVKVCHTPGSPTATGQSCPSSPVFYASYALVSPKGRPESTGRFERGALSPERRRPSTVAH